jgi:hypothetical protein
MQPAEDRNYETMWQWQRQAMFTAMTLLLWSEKISITQKLSLKLAGDRTDKLNYMKRLQRDSSFGQQTELARIYDHRNCIWGNLHKF